MDTRQLTVKQQAFLRHYLGADPRLHGNATQCYLKVYQCSLKAAESGGARLLQNVKVIAEISIHQDKVAEKINVTAEYVLRQSVRYLEIAFGDIPAPQNFNPSGVKGALEIIGKHVAVKAFQENIEHKHVHRLEQRLAQRSKQIEDRATANQKLELVK